jgi:hypothetical protein
MGRIDIDMGTIGRRCERVENRSQQDVMLATPRASIKTLGRKYRGGGGTTP